jgi:two-component system CheB/CheR fusion protein
VATFVDISPVKDAQRYQRVLDALPAHVAVLDRVGIIRSVNRAWREFAGRNGDPLGCSLGVGADYLATCRAAADTDEYARRALQALTDVLTGRREVFVMAYPCHAPTEERWFLMHIKPLGGLESGAVVSHLNVTGWLAPDLMAGAQRPGEARGDE